MVSTERKMINTRTTLKDLYRDPETLILRRSLYGIGIFLVKQSNLPLTSSPNDTGTHFGLGSSLCPKIPTGPVGQYN